MNHKAVFSLPSLAAGPQSLFLMLLLLPTFNTSGLCLLCTSSFVPFLSLSSLPHEIFLQQSSLYLPLPAGACRYLPAHAPRSHNLQLPLPFLLSSSSHFPSSSASSLHATLLSSLLYFTLYFSFESARTCGCAQVRSSSCPFSRVRVRLRVHMHARDIGAAFSFPYALLFISALKSFWGKGRDKNEEEKEMGVGRVRGRGRR